MPSLAFVICDNKARSIRILINPSVAYYEAMYLCRVTIFSSVPPCASNFDPPRRTYRDQQGKLYEYFLLLLFKMYILIKRILALCSLRNLSSLSRLSNIRLSRDSLI